MKKTFLISGFSLLIFFSACSWQKETKNFVDDGKKSLENLAGEATELVEDVENAADKIKEASDAVKKIKE